MEKYSQITNHRRNGKQLDANFKVSSIVDAKTTPSRANNFSGNGLHSQGQLVRPNHSVINDLIPYPSSAISTTIERANGTAPSYLENNNTAHSGVKSLAENSKKKSKEKKNLNLQSSPSHSAHFNADTPSQNRPCDEKVSFDSDDIIRIVKLLQEKKENSTQTECSEKCSQHVQVSTTGADSGDSYGTNDNNNKTNLSRSNHTLKSQLDQLSYIIEEMSKERSSTNLQLHSLRKLIKVKELKIEELNAEKEKCLADNDELRFAMKNIETLINDYQKSLLAKNAESDALRKELNQGNQDRNSVLSELEQSKSDLRAKEELIAELYRVNSLNQEEMTALKEHYYSLGQQLTKSNAEMHTLLAHKSMLEQRLASVDTTGRVQANTMSASVDAKALTLKAKCNELRQSLHAMKETLVAQYERKNDIIGKIQSSLQSNVAHNRTTALSEATVKSYEAKIEHLKAINEKIFRDAAKHSEEVDSAKDQLTVKLRSLQLENTALKETNETYQQRIVALNTDYVKLRDESVHSSGELAKCRLQIDKFESELSNAHTQLNQLQRGKEAENGNVQQLQQENRDLRGVIDKLEEDRSLLEGRVKALSSQWEEASQFKAQLNSTLSQLELSRTELEAEQKSKQGVHDEVNQLRAELKSRKDKNSNLESNIQMLTKKYRELSTQLNSKVTLVDQICQTTLCSAELEQIQISLHQLQLALVERDTCIRNQNDQLLRLSVDCEKDQTERTAMQSKLELLERCLTEKDQLVQTLQNTAQSAENNNQLTGRIEDLKADLTNEKDRFKGLSQSLFNEKRLNSKLKKELSRIKQTSQLIDSSDLSTLDLHQLRTRLKGKIGQLKELAAELENRRMKQELDSSSAITETSHSSEIPSMKEMIESFSPVDSTCSLPNDFIIEMLQEPSEGVSSSHNDASDPSSAKPLSRLHSSIEDIKQELQSIKQSLTFDK